MEEEQELKLDSHTLYKDNQGWAWPIWRAVPYSHQQKKEQLKEKRKRRQEKDERANADGSDLPSRDDLLLAQLNSLEISSSKIESVFEKESQEEIEARKKRGFAPLELHHRDHVWREEFESTEIVDMPVRPPYVIGESAEQLEERERGIFHSWMSEVISKYGSRLNYFEMNLEVWRQLWRVIERSDILLLVVDARFPLFHFPPSLYNFVINVIKKPLILILNKTDIVDKIIVDEWETYFTEKYPSLKIVRFSSFAPPLDGETLLEPERKRKMEKGRKKYENGKGKKALLNAIQSFGITKKEVSHAEGKKVDDTITIGAVGQPNVGKSSLVNGLAGKKVVSTSSTPGHTKHFQTIYIDLSDDSGLTTRFKLCDCPGLVFPAVDICKELQVISGVFPISQVREVFSAIRYLAERVPIERIYNLSPPSNGSPWSPYLLLEAYAIKRGYREAKTGQPDVHRAGGEILRDCLNGHIVISWPPPGVSLPSVSSSSCSASSCSSASEGEEIGTEKGEGEGGEHDGANDEHYVNHFRENQRKKRERKLKKKQQTFEIIAE
jgi:ribosome biogenesis GTPase A